MPASNVCEVWLHCNKNKHYIQAMLTDSEGVHYIYKVVKYKVKMALPAAKPTPLPTIKWTTNQDGYELYQVAGARLEHEGYGIQIASSQQFDGIMRKVADLQALNIDGILLSVQNDKNTGAKTYKIIIGPYETAADAHAFRNEWLKKGLYGTFVVNLADQYLENMSF